MPNNNVATYYWTVDSGTSTSSSTTYNNGYVYHIPAKDNNVEKVVEKPLPKDKQLHVVFKIKKDK